MSRSVTTTVGPATQLAIDSIAKARFATAASLWKAAMVFGYLWIAGAILMAIVFAATGPGGDDAPDGKTVVLMVMNIYAVAFWVGQIAAAAVFTLAAWTFHIFAKDKADSF